MRTGDKYNERIVVCLAPSRVLRAGAALAGLATLGVAASLPIAHEPRIALVAWAGLASLHALRRLRPARQLALVVTGAVEVDGVRGRLAEGSFVAPWLTIVRWRPEGARFDRTLAIAADALAPDEFRRLRVLLRWGGTGRDGP